MNIKKEVKPEFIIANDKLESFLKDSEIHTSKNSLKRIEEKKLLTKK